MSGKIAKPVMKGHFWAWFKRDVPLSLVGIVAFGGVMYQLICVRTKRAYTDFYKNYDPEKAQEQMIKTGLFNAINAKGVVNKEVFD